MSASVSFVARFSVGDAVTIDGDKEFRAIVVGVLFRKLSTEYEVSWLHNGQVHTVWLASFRVERAA